MLCQLEYHKRSTQLFCHHLLSTHMSHNANRSVLLLQYWQTEIRKLRNRLIRLLTTNETFVIFNNTNISFSDLTLHGTTPEVMYAMYLNNEVHIRIPLMDELLVIHKNLNYFYVKLYHYYIKKNVIPKPYFFARLNIYNYTV